MADKQYKLVGFYSHYLAVTPESVRLDEDLTCDAVVISNWNAIDDNEDSYIGGGASLSGSDLSNEEIYWGFNKALAHQLFAGNQTDLIGVNNLNEIYVRSNKNLAGKRIFFSCYRYEEIKEKN